GNAEIFFQPTEKKAPVSTVAADGCCDCCMQNDWCGREPCGPPGRVWIGAEYLLWWARGAHIPALVTTTDSFGGFGRLGDPSTRVLFGDQTIDRGARSGFRLTGGFWIDDCQLWGIQSRYFNFAVRHTEFSAGPENQFLYIPYTDSETGQQKSFAI